MYTATVTVDGRAYYKRVRTETEAYGYVVSMTVLLMSQGTPKGSIKHAVRPVLEASHA